ncbi:MAG: hypothetical protein RLY47_538 [Candidatus Parcubacteria bacterium]|jgi:hypothetical protein
MGNVVTVEVRSKLAQQKLAHEFEARGISEEEYLSRPEDGENTTFKIPQDMCDLLLTDSDFRRGLDYKIVAGTARRTRKHPKRARPKLKRMVTKGLVTRGIPPRTPTA